MAHFFFLSAFSWMNILAWSIFLMISRVQRRVSCAVAGANTNNYPLHRNFPLFTVGWAVPLLIIFIGVAMDSNGDFMGYGAGDLCWMSWNHRGIIFLFVLPSGLAILANAVLVTATAVSLIQIRKASALAQPVSLTSECIFHVVFRISIGMGLEWLSGVFLYLIPGSVFLQYTFVLGVGLHGFWLLTSTLTLNTFLIPFRAQFSKICIFSYPPIIFNR